MKHLLSKSQRDIVANQFDRLNIYKAIKRPCFEFSKQYLPHFHLHAEDVLYEYFNIIDWIRDEADNKIELQIDNLWGDLYEDIDEISGNGVTQSEKEFAVAEILSVVLLSIQTIEDSCLFKSLALRISNLINEHATRYWNDLQTDFLYNFQIWDIEKIEQELREYIASEYCYSEKIEDICNATIEFNISNQKSANKLTTAQVAILLIETLDISVETVNATALGNLIDSITGGTRGRVEIEKLRSQNNGYKSSDALRIAELLDKLKPELAKAIKNGVIE